MTTSRLLIRPARPDDAPRLIEFNQRLARETEGLELDPHVLAEGVAAALSDPDRLRYIVAELDGAVVGQTAVTREWSDWRGGWFWWLQSVYVLPEARRHGVFRHLHLAVREAARSHPDVVGLRLYVERHNQTARTAYERLGLSDGGYLVMEEVWANRPGPAARDFDEPPGAIDHRS